MIFRQEEWPQFSSACGFLGSVQIFHGLVGGIFCLLIQVMMKRPLWLRGEEAELWGGESSSGGNPTGQAKTPCNADDVGSRPGTAGAGDENLMWMWWIREEFQYSSSAGWSQPIGRRRMRCVWCGGRGPPFLWNTSMSRPEGTWCEPDLLAEWWIEAPNLCLIYHIRKKNISNIHAVLFASVTALWRYKTHM